jgi:hypothetical protein
MIGLMYSGLNKVKTFAATLGMRSLEIVIKNLYFEDPEVVKGPSLILKITFMKKFAFVFIAAVVLFCFSCSSNAESKTETKTVKTASASTAVPVTAAAAFTPYMMIVVEHPISSFDLWLPVFTAHDAERKAMGLTVLRIGRGMEDTNSVVIRMKADDLDKAKEFSKALKEDMRDAGRTVAPRISYLNVLRDDSSFTEISERALVSYHVKDFDNWLKVYDEKGKSTREKHGLIDRGLARGVEDPNTVYVLFAISNLRKARARLSSSELRRILRNAGVEGGMTVSFYKVVQ